MLYASAIDGDTHSEELESILDSTDGDTFKRAKKIYSQMSDHEVLECIGAHRQLYAATEDERKALLEAISSVVAADGKHSPIEGQMLRVVRKLL